MKSIFLIICGLPNLLVSPLSIQPENDLKANQLDETSQLDGFSFTVLNEDDWFPKSGYNEDANLNFTELTNKYGYPTETHTVTTEDGYILTIFRMLKGQNCKGPMKKTPVIAMHGLFDSADSFVSPGTKIGIGYLLSDECYDVWCGNNRGNKYGLKHVNYTTVPDTGEFWNFSYDEQGMYDLKAIVDYVLNTTQSEKVAYIGHSQGTTDFWVLTSTTPEYNLKFKMCIALAPVAWLRHTTSVQFQIIGALGAVLKTSLETDGNKELLRLDSPTDMIAEATCQVIPKFCKNILPIVSGGDPKEFADETIKITVGHFPQPTSAKNLVHYSQAINVDKFRKYDYGTSTQNMEKYGTPEPPEYDISKITAPVALIIGKGDLVANEKDAKKLEEGLGNVVNCSFLGYDWGHGHFLFAKTLPEKLYPMIKSNLENHCS